MGSAVAVALAAAVAFGWSTALMHHSASGAPNDGGGTAALLRHVVQQWRWLVGMAASLLGLGLHIWALHLGDLAVVQPLVVTALVFSFIFRDALDRRFPTRHVLAWSAVTAVGLAIFVTAGSSTTTTAAMDGRAATILIGAGAVFAAGATYAATRVTGTRSGVLLGTGAGIVFGLIGGTLKAVTDAAAAGDLLSSWPLYTLVPLGIAGFVLNQRAYHQAPLHTSLPALNLLNPLVAVAFGIVVFHERPADDVVSLLGEIVGLAAVLAGIFFLARTDGDGEPLPTPFPA